MDNITETELYATSDLAAATAEARAAEQSSYKLLIEDQIAEDIDLFRLELSQSTIRRCSFLRSNLSETTFRGVLFQDCDFAGSNLSSSYFETCTFVSSRFTGADFNESRFKNIKGSEVNLQYCNFSEAKFDLCRFSDCDFSYASITEAELKRFEPENCRFINADFFQTSLRGIDFTGNDLTGFLVSDNMNELVGSIMDPYQAAEVARKIGIIVDA